MLRMAGAPEVTDRAAIEKAINSPVDTQSIAENREGKAKHGHRHQRHVHSTRLEGILDVVLKELNGAGIADEHVTIIVALGAHRPMTRQDFAKKIGTSILDRVNVA